MLRLALLTRKKDMLSRCRFGRQFCFEFQATLLPRYAGGMCEAVEHDQWDPWGRAVGLLGAVAETLGEDVGPLG